MSAQALVQCINHFASRKSNPVLSILPDSGVFEFNQKYPRPMLSFPGIGLRAYYHCHTYDLRPAEEHGHFHIFLKMDGDPELENEKWSHLAGLCMDNMGQPVNWFTVNHWVTGEAWSTAELLTRKLKLLPEKNAQDLTLVEQWIKAIIEFYASSLSRLLEERDQEINKLAQNKDIDSILQDRVVYELSRYTINLLNDMECYASLDKD